jgi:WD40 repeat protein
LRAWDVTSGELRNEFLGQQHSADIQSMAFLAGDRTIVSAGGSAILKLWDASTGKCLGSLRGHMDKIWGVSASPDGTSFATASSDGTIKVWGPRPPPLVRTLTPLTVRVRSTRTALASTPGGGTLIVARGVGGRAFVPPDDRGGYLVDADLEVRGFDPNTGAQTFYRALERGKQTYGAELSPGGTHVVFVFPDSTATVWHVATGKRLATISGAQSLCWLREHVLLVKRPNGALELVDATAGQTGRVLVGAESLNRLATSPQGEFLAGRIHDQLVIWDPATNRAARRRLVDQPGYTAGAFSADATILAVGDSRAVIQLWDVATLEPRGTLLGHSDAILRLTFSPDGRTLVSESRDGTVKLWDVAAGEELLTLPEPFRGTLAHIRFAPDGRTLTAITQDEGVLRLHRLSTGLPTGLDSEEGP